jgi:hypothetical protein
MVILAAPVKPSDHALGRASPLKAEYLERVAPVDPLVWLPKLKTPRVRLELISGDAGATDEVAKKIGAAAPTNVEAKHFENALIHFHETSDGKLYEWLKKQLRPELEKGVEVQNATPDARPVNADK